MRQIAVLLLLTGCASQPAPVTQNAEIPRRIVSMNPCVDGILMEIADPEHIAAISHYSHDPRATSTPLAWSQHFPAVSDAAEDVIAAEPDLVIAGPHVAIQTIAALKRLGIPMMQVAVPQTIAQSKTQITAIAKRIGRTKAGDALTLKIDTALAKSHATAPRINALIWQGSGLVPGKGTLADELLIHTGFRNVSTTLGLRAWDVLPLEGLLFSPPDVLLSGMANMGESEGEANRMLSHPALRHARAHIHVAPFPSSLLNCGGPTIIKSVQRLAAVRHAMEHVQ